MCYYIYNKGKQKTVTKHYATEIENAVRKNRVFEFSFYDGFLSRLIRNRKILLQKQIYIKMEDWLPMDIVDEQSSEAVIGGSGSALF